MPVKLTPNGTRGGQVPRIPPALRGIVFSLGNLYFRMRGFSLIQVTTVGSRSGREHTVPLLWFPDVGGAEDRWLLVAAAAGSARHPAWFFNMARNPDRIWVHFRGQRTRVEAESLEGAELEEAWRRVTAAWPGYANYRKKTDREIPIVRLKPA